MLAQRLGVAGLVVAVAGEGFLVAQWAGGDMTDREFISRQANLGGGIVGGVAGGAASGSLVGWAGGPFAPVTVPVAIVAGGLAGGWAVATAADQVVGSYYELSDRRQREELFNFLVAHYQD